MSENGNGTKASFWTEVPRQVKQKRCHECKKRTFYWLFEAEGAICSDCVNLRNMARPPVKTEAAGGTGEGRKSKSTISPTKKIAIITRRANGESKASISREVHVAHNTVTKVLDEADFDKIVEQGRFDSVRLIPVALKGLELSMSKGDGNTCNRFLENVGVLAEKPRKPPSDPTLTLAIQNLMGNVTVQVAPTEKAINAEVISTNTSSPSSSQP